MRLILSSKSPRRQQLVKELGIPFEVRIKEVVEDYPEHINLEEVPEYLARKKAGPFKASLKENEVLLTSDTVVFFDGRILEKPKDRDEAIEMIRVLSNNTHTVISGVALHSSTKQISFSDRTKVHFNRLSESEITYYVDKFKPFDKAGSYGIQEWIGYIGVKGIEGCYYNVMGLPVQAIYSKLKTEFNYELSLG